MILTHEEEQRLLAVHDMRVVMSPRVRIPSFGRLARWGYIKPDLALSHFGKKFVGWIVWRPTKRGDHMAKTIRNRRMK